MTSSALLAPPEVQSPNGVVLKRILDQLRSGRWVTEEIAEEFRISLVSRVKHLGLNSTETLPLPFLAAIAYRRASSEPRECGVGPQRIEAVGDGSVEWVEFWTAAVGNIHQRARFSPANESDRQRLSEAMTTISKYAPATATEVNKRISYVCPFSSEEFRSASHPHYFGAIFARLDRTPQDLALSIVHEMAHQELFLLNLLDRLVNAPFDYHLVHAPYQERDRPPIGRLHSAHALFRMVQFERECGSPFLERHRRILGDTANAFLSQELTGFSKELVDAVYREAAR
jgi:hypothetical protein